jgi:uncharacterized lipoprotein YmbA
VRKFALVMMALALVGCASLQPVEQPVYYKLQTEPETKGSLKVIGSLEIEYVGKITVEVHGKGMYEGGEKKKPADVTEPEPDAE